MPARAYGRSMGVMTASQNTDTLQADTPQVDAVPSLTAPAGLNLLGDPAAGSCCGGACAVPGA